MTADFDVAIVGAGPAGAWAACELARSGARVAVIDGSHPREKPCGGGVSARALRALGPLADDIVARGVRVTRGIFTAGDTCASVPFPPGASGLPALVVISRREFDARLLCAAREAGAHHVARRVVGVASGGGGWTITTDGSRLTSAWLVGADGANSFVRRRLARPFERSQLSIASGYYVDEQSGEEIDVAFTARPPGYLWSFPRPDHLAVGICGQADETSSTELFTAARDWIRRRYPPEVRCRRYSWPIPSPSPSWLRSAPLSGERWMLIGDAAGLVDPITREGIFYALHSAALAARALGGPAASASYARALRGTIASELTRAARMKARFFQPPFSRLLVKALQRSARIGALMADLVSGDQTYEGLRRRLLFTGEWRLAMEYLRLGA